MRRKKFVKVLIIVLAFLLIASLIIIANWDFIKTNLTGKVRLAPDEKTTQLSYSPNQLIIKFSPELGSQIGKIFKEGKALKTITGTDNLDKLNAKYKVKKIDRVFKDLEAKGKAKGKDFITAAEDFEDTKAKFPQRANRAVKNPKIPDLENIYVIEFKDSQTDILSIVSEYSEDPNVAYAEPNYIAKIFMLPNDKYYNTEFENPPVYSWGQNYPDLWALKSNKLNSEPAWDISQGINVIVAVIDTGVDYTHPDLGGCTGTQFLAGNCAKVVGGYDFVNNDNNPMDDNGHGTHVSGTIAAIANNNIGIVGVAPNSKIMALKGFDNTGAGYDDDLANAITYAANNGADILSNSWGGGSSALIANATTYAYSLGSVIVAAAGNSNTNVAFFSPANLGEVIAVSASDENDQRCSFSNYGMKIDVAAPGCEGSTGASMYNILSLLPIGTSYFRTYLPEYVIGSNYMRLAGTSMAAPHVSGVAALILSHNPSFTNEQVRQVLKESADDILTPGFDINSGYGRVNTLKAVNIVSPTNIKITYPTSDTSIGPQQQVNIMGSASGQNFNYSELYYSPDNMITWIPIGSRSYTQVNNGVLGVWNAAQLGTGFYTIILKVSTKEGHEFQDYTTVFKDSTIPVITNPASQINPAISGNRIVWQDYRNGNWDIYMYDLSTKTEKQITTNSANQTNPTIDGDNIVYADNRNAYGDIYIYDLSTKKESRITTSTAGTAGHNYPNYPDISGNKIVYQSFNIGVDWDIYIYDLSTNTGKVIALNSSGQTNPAVSGNVIVWQDYRGLYDIYLYDLTTNTEQDLSNDSINQQVEPAISGDKVVWADGSTYGTQIYVYDLSSNTKHLITDIINELNNNHLAPDISGNKVVWQLIGADRDIYVYDLINNIQERITFNPAYQINPAVSGNVIVWQDFRNGNWDIYMYDLSGSFIPPTPVIPVAPSGLVGNVVSSSQINLNWADNSDNEDGFKIERSLDGNSFTQIASVGANVNNYSDIGLASATTYYYRVLAFNSVGNSAYSNTASATTLTKLVLPSMPSNLVATAISKSQINLNWIDNSNNEDGFKIERSTSATRGFSQIASVGANVNTYSNIGLSAGKKYYYRIRSYNSPGDSAYSNVAFDTTPRK